MHRLPIHHLSAGRRIDPRFRTGTEQIPDDQAAALREKAAAQGLTLKDWLGRLAAEDTEVDKARRAQAAADRIRQIQQRPIPTLRGDGCGLCPPRSPNLRGGVVLLRRVH